MLENDILISYIAGTTGRGGEVPTEIEQQRHEGLDRVYQVAYCMVTCSRCEY